MKTHKFNRSLPNGRCADCGKTENEHKKIIEESVSPQTIRDIEDMIYASKVLGLSPVVTNDAIEKIMSTKNNIS